MSTLEQAEVQSKIAQIIERSRHHEEQFLIDSRAAALHIIKFLKNNELLRNFNEENEFEMLSTVEMMHGVKVA